MIHVFGAASADEAWAKAAARIESRLDVLHQSSRIGDTLELLHTVISIDDPRERWVLSRHPAINPAFAIAEVVWILAGRNDSAFMNHWNPALPRFAGSGQTYYGAYGYRLRRNLKIDQLERAFSTLNANPSSRQVVLQIWDGTLDLPDVDGTPRDPDIPCNICSMLKVREGRLDWMQVLRSNDLFLGVPHNIVQFTSLQEVIAGWLGVELGTYHQLSDSLHVYERDIDAIRNRTEVLKTRNPDSLMLPKHESERVWREFESRMEGLVNDCIRVSEWRSLAAFNAPQAFQNLFAVVLADDARRRGWIELEEEAIASCTNPLLLTAWQNWALRQRARLPTR
jgi:thymidylate synthase